MTALQFKWNAEQLHDFVLFMANTGLRPDEIRLLQFRDVELIHDKGTDEDILEIEVRGKRGVGWCLSMPGAVLPFQRLSKRKRLAPDTHYSKDAELIKPQPTNLLFPGNHVKMFNNVLAEESLKFDRDNQPRTAYSLRHTYICLRLLERADIYQIAKNCRTTSYIKIGLFKNRGISKIPCPKIEGSLAVGVIQGYVMDTLGWNWCMVAGYIYNSIIQIR